MEAFYPPEARGTSSPMLHVQTAPEFPAPDTTGTGIFHTCLVDERLAGGRRLITSQGAAQSLGLGSAAEPGVPSPSHPIVPLLPGTERDSCLWSICIVCKEWDELKAECAFGFSCSDCHRFLNYGDLKSVLNFILLHVRVSE